MKKVLIRVTGIAIVVAAAWGGYRFFQQLPQRQETIATARVRRGDVVIRAFTRGELRAVRSVTLTAPNLFGTVQVTRLAPVGSLAHEKDLIVEFDDSERRASLEETLLQVEQIDEQIKKARADLAIRDNQDEVDLLKTRYAVRRAELEVKRNELLSPIDAKKNLLTLEEQRRRLKQLEVDIKSRKEQAQAEIAVLQANRAKSMIDVQREKMRIAQAKLLSTMTGLVAIKQNRGGYFSFGQQVPDIREGDTLQPGMQVADVLDLSELEVVAKVGELDRANLHEGQDVLLQLDAVPEKRFNGKIKGMSGTASSNVFSGDPAKKFDVIFSIDMRQLLTELGVKPEAIKRIMDTAAQNAKKAPASSMSLSSITMGGPPGGGFPGMGGGQGGDQGGGMMGGPGGMAGMQQMGEQGGEAREGRGQRGEGGGGRGGFGGMRGMSEEDRAKFQEAMKKALNGKNLQDLSPEERQKIFAKIRESMGMPPRSGASGGAPGAAGEGGQRGQGGEGGLGAEGRQRGQRAQGGEGAPQSFGFTRGPGGGPSSAGSAGSDLPMQFGSTNVGGFSDQDREKAKLPPPPEEDSQLEVLLRPGLLADVEIIVEKIPNALHVPAQGVFEGADGRQVVYVKTGSRFEARTIKLAKRSESTMVIQEGVKEGEIIALSDPNAKKSKKGDSKSEKKSGGGNAMGGMPAGGGKK